ncbi:MAG: hypothetical protein KBT01_01450, partial [Clostridiales bacterium]|nr:hypothetical protein [Candidatus Blautia equi]
VKNTRLLAVTTPSLDAQQVRNGREAFARMGFSREECKLMDYEESFYYYIFTQKKDLWNRNIAWYSFDGNDVTYRNFEMKNTEKNVQIRLSEPQYTVLPVEGPVRDAAFARFIRETIKGEFISSVHLNGEGFDQEWAGESIKLMCFQRRKVFYGNNLYARGACASGVEKTEEKNLKNYRFMSSSLVTHSVGMDMRVNGANAFHPLLEAGINWFECSGGCELILDRAEELIFSVSDGVEKWKISMELPGVPKRPNKTTRLSLHMEYVSKDECVITVKDLGFGDLFPSTGKIWKERTNWLKGEAEA